MMQAGPNDWEILAVSDQLVKSRKRIRCGNRVRKNKKRTIAAQFLNVPHRCGSRPNQFMEIFDEIRRRQCTVCFSQCGISRYIDKTKSRFSIFTYAHRLRIQARLRRYLVWGPCYQAG